MKSTSLLLCVPLLFVAACSSQQSANVTNAAITIAANAMPCYNAVKAATAASSTVANVLNGAAVATSNAACAAIDAETADLIASAINAQAPVTSGTTSAPAPATSSQ